MLEKRGIMCDLGIDSQLKGSFIGRNDKLMKLGLAIPSASIEPVFPYRACGLLAHTKGLQAWVGM